MSFEQFRNQFLKKRRWLVITGAGISEASGIPTYRDQTGKWLRSDPITHQQFIQSESMRRRYWARSAVGLQWMSRAQPNQTHQTLVNLEARGFLTGLITQNVDRLHQSAGHQDVIDLHGRIDRVKCLSCGSFESRASLQERLVEANPIIPDLTAEVAPDGDANLEERLTQMIEPVKCLECAGELMPDVVFYGGSVPAHINQMTAKKYHESEGILVLGSSLMVYSSFRFCKKAAADGKPILIVNLGKTRADEIADIKLNERCSVINQL